LAIRYNFQTLIIYLYLLVSPIGENEKKTHQKWVFFNNTFYYIKHR
jgi:hypothetical protein